MKAIYLLFFLTVGIAAQAQDSHWLVALNHKKVVATIDAGLCYPLQAADNSSLTLEIPSTQMLEIYLLNPEQEVIKQEKVLAEAGTFTHKISLYGLPEGHYTIYVQGKKSFLKRSVFVQRS